MAFEIGDVVMLKSGGPSMTVKEINQDADNNGENLIFCTWFDKNNKVHSEEFEEDLLVIDNRNKPVGGAYVR